MSEKEVSYKEIWTKLSKVKVDKFVEKKMNLDYLSWANCWYLLMEHYPQAEYVFKDNINHADGSVEVMTFVGINKCGRHMTLPVMDFKMKAIKNPSARDISDARMRCLVKNISLFGLGISLYRGLSDDLPDESKQEEAKEEAVVKDISKAKSNAEEFIVEAQAKEEEGISIGDANAFIEIYLKSLGLYKTKEECRSQFSMPKNAEVINQIKIHHKKTYDDFIERIKEAIQDLPEGEEKVEEESGTPDPFGFFDEDETFI